MATDTTSSQDPRVLASQLELPQHLISLYETTVEQSNISTEVSNKLRLLLCRHADTFAQNATDIGFCDALQHDIDTGDHSPIKQSPRRPPLAASDAEDEILEDMLRSGVIQPSTSPWASPVCLVKKKDGTYRFCVDYRKVNAVSEHDAFPVPDMQDVLDSIRGARHFATIDLLSGYWQLGMTDRAKERSAFCKRPFRVYAYVIRVIRQDIYTFCRLMTIVLSDLLWSICLSYIDDIIIFGRTPEELLERLDTVFSRLREFGLKAKPSKCELFRTEIRFLGHMVSGLGVEPLPDKLSAIRDWPTPHCIRDVRAFYGLASYYRRFVRNFAAVAEPLSRLSKKGTHFIWTEEAQQAFDRLKVALMETPTLAFSFPDLPCILDTDASDVAVGAVLSQVIEGEERPIAFFSQVLNSAQRNYCPTRGELLAVIASLQHFRHYLLNAKVILRSDHYSLKWLRTFKQPEGILARWIEPSQSLTTLSNTDQVVFTAMQMESLVLLANNVGIALQKYPGSMN